MHNHDVNAETYASYPVARGIKDEVVAARVSAMVQLGSKRSKIYDFLLECGENVVKRDVDNIGHKYRKSVSGVNDDEDTAAEVARFAARDPGNVVTVDETSRGESGVISLSSRHMRSTYARFPELLMVDCTHKTNRYGMCS